MSETEITGDKTPTSYWRDERLVVVDRAVVELMGSVVGIAEAHHVLGAATRPQLVTTGFDVDTLSFERFDRRLERGLVRDFPAGRNKALPFALFDANAQRTIVGAKMNHVVGVRRRGRHQPERVTGETAPHL